jgi:LCP family protein required for cell wall assembly
MANINSSSRLTKRHLKKRRKKHFITWVIIPLIVLISGASIYVSSVYNKAQNVFQASYEDDGRDGGSALRVDVVNPKEHNVSVLFVGIDRGGSRTGDVNKGLSDALMLATFNQEDKTINLLSIPRDTYVYIPSRDSYTKITHAHAYGGIKETLDTVENLFDMPVDYYTRIDFDAFIDIVDALDGIEVEVPYAISEMDSNDRQGTIQLSAGQQWLDGEEALALARTRKYDNDFERGNRQQMILKAMMDRAVSINALANINNLLEAVGDNMQTNMTFTEMKDFSSYISTKLSINTLSLEGSDMVTDAYYFKLDEQHLEEVKRTLHAHLELE